MIKAYLEIKREVDRLLLVGLISKAEAETRLSDAKQVIDYLVREKLKKTC